MPVHQWGLQVDRAAVLAEALGKHPLAHEAHRRRAVEALAMDHLIGRLRSGEEDLL